MRFNTKGTLMGSFVRRKQAQALDADIVLDAKAVVKALNQLEPGLKKQMVAEMKKISRPMEKNIKDIIPTTSPFGSAGHSEGQGRLSWDYGTWKKGGSRVAPNNVTASFSTGRARGFRTTNSLFKVWVRNPMVALSGTAGKGSGSPRYGVTKEYAWRGTTRRHRNAGQGQKLINKVRSSGLYNFFYKEADKTLPDVERQIKLVWERYSAKVSRKI
jgi:hypothetical protein